MGDVFKGWRRKVGVILLMVACVVAGMWFRSSVVGDFFEFSVRDRQHAFGSFHGILLWRTWDRIRTNNGWQAIPCNRLKSEEILDLKPLAAMQPRQCALQYAWIAPPLTLLSAYLLLWKPRQRTGAEHA